MPQVAHADVAALARLVGPDPDAVIEEMEEQAEREEFPTVGPEVGGWMTLLARLTDATRAFEFGSGFGYSAYWLARGMDDGEVVLTEIDRDELDAAREYFRQGDIADMARFEHGDAIDIVEDYDGPFDVVLIDNEKQRYVEAFEAVREKVRTGGVVLADNAVSAGIFDREDVLGLLRGEARDAPAASEGIADYLTHVDEQERFETALLPVGEGVAVSVKL